MPVVRSAGIVSAAKDYLVPLSISYSQGLTSAWSNVATFVPKLVAFLIIVIIGFFIARIVSRSWPRSCKGSDLTPDRAWRYP